MGVSIGGRVVIVRAGCVVGGVADGYWVRLTGVVLRGGEWDGNED